MRAVGAEFGLPERLVWRQPFPGPGLAIRVVGGCATRERLEVLREADAILQIAARMMGELREVNRVVLDVTSKPPGTIEWE